MEATCGFHHNSYFTYGLWYEMPTHWFQALCVGFGMVKQPLRHTVLGYKRCSCPLIRQSYAYHMQFSWIFLVIPSALIAIQFGSLREKSLRVLICWTEPLRQGITVFISQTLLQKAARQTNCSLIVKNKRKCETPFGVLHLRFYSTKQAAWTAACNCNAGLNCQPLEICPFRACAYHQFNWWF